jgi:import receptor subunit TOM20
MSARSATQIVLLTAATAVTGLVGYAVYFDYMRRNNPDFRKNIRK